VFLFEKHFEKQCLEKRKRGMPPHVTRRKTPSSLPKPAALTMAGNKPKQI